MKLLSILVLFFCLNSTINAQKQKDLVIITGKVSDYDGNPIGNCSVMCIFRRIPVQHFR